MTTKEKRLLAAAAISLFVFAFTAGFLLGKTTTEEWLLTDLPDRVNDLIVAIDRLFNR